MDKQGRQTTRICCCLLVAMVIINAPQEVNTLPCNGATGGAQTVNAIGGASLPAEERRKVAGPAIAAPSPPVIVSPTASAIKKDLFMSRGWGASGMPFSMFYLNHYTKAQKAYAQQSQQQQLQQQQQQQLQQQKLLQQQQQQQQQQQLLLQAQQQQPLELQRIQQQQQQQHQHQAPESLPDRSLEEAANAMPDQPVVPYASRYEPELVAVHAQQLRTDTDYVDSSPSVRTTSKGTTARRQYTVPQLFVSYGWGPMG